MSKTLVGHSVVSIVDCLLKIVPVTEPLYGRLTAWKDGVFLELPEDNKHLWHEVGRILWDCFPQDEKDWEGWHWEGYRTWSRFPVTERSILEGVVMSNRVAEGWALVVNSEFTGKCQTKDADYRGVGALYQKEDRWRCVIEYSNPGTDSDFRTEGRGSSPSLAVDECRDDVLAWTVGVIRSRLNTLIRTLLYRAEDEDVPLS
jgi:hypothetical protein